MQCTRSIALAAVAAAALGFTSNAIADNDVGFAKPTFVSTTLAGGEPLVFADTKHGTLIYTSHEGTTHLYRNGVATIPANWLANYRNQVNNWYSEDNGKTWKLSQVDGVPASASFMGSPTMSQGFSDPDLTQDKGGRIYNTGINLASDSIFSTSNGGKTWDRGTAQCHEGDRPWLAGSTDVADTAWLATNASTGGHIIMETNDGGNTCNGAPVGGGIPDSGGNGKLFYNPVFHELVEPNGGGVATYKPGVDTAFHKWKDVRIGGIYAHWSSIAVDKAGTLYMVWDTLPAGAKGNGAGCPDTLTGGAANTQKATPNAIMYAYSKDDGRTWSKPITVQSGDYGNGHIEFWPWLAAGDDGRVNMVWYESDRAVDLDCAPSAISIKTTTITKANEKAPKINVVDAAGRPIHYGTVCQGGTTCVATGEDRRLGDFFTQNPDANGCVMIASGDTTQWDSTTFTTMMYSLPIIIRQNAGPSLYKNVDCGKVG